MRRVKWDLSQVDHAARLEWENWLTRAAEGRSRLLANGPARFDSDIWSEAKRWMLKHIYNGKCGYCEASIDAHSFGDADHWRPKGAVTRRDDAAPIPQQADGTEHTGYWWLAYDWENLVPACQRCNSTGKGTQFPVDSKYVFEPSDQLNSSRELDAFEQPLLLHPIAGPNPADHLEFDETGQVNPRAGSKLGATSIDVYGLRRPRLRDERFKHMRFLEDALSGAVAKALAQKCSIADVLAPYADETATYSQAVAAHLERLITQLFATP